jgi:hypothetical protein
MLHTASSSRPTPTTDTQFRLASTQQHHPSFSYYPRDRPLDYPTLVHLDPGKLDFDFFNTDLMQSDAWGQLPQHQFNPKLGRVAHQRDTSLSSMASTGGPASPFNQNSVNPQIAINDYRNSESLPDMTAAPTHDSADSSGQYYQLAKSMNSYAGYQNLNQTIPEMAYPVTVPGPAGKPRGDGLLPAPEFGVGSNRSQPDSVASSVTSDSPATPNNGDSDHDRRNKGYGGNVPKLGRTMTDIYGDELYSPNFAITSTPSTQSHLAVSPISNDVFNQRLNAANRQHLSVSQSPNSTYSRERSPTVNGSASLTFNSAQRLREHSKARQDAQALQSQVNGQTCTGEPETPKTISPKDAVLEFNDDDNTGFTLFPQEPPGAFDMDLNKPMVSQQATDLAQQMMSHQPVTGRSNQTNFLSASLPTNIQIPQQYPFVARNQVHNASPPRLSSSGSSSPGSGIDLMVNRHHPMGRHADGGTYTCTYHGCTLRFETPALLQKHKREGHRQTGGLGMGRDNLTTNSLSSQAGPHRCDRINPSTGKSCNAVFSRPYDLTRHEDTIHNARKQKVRCDLCTEEKTFSRADALTRHYRVCHPDMPIPGKHGRRNGGM